MLCLPKPENMLPYIAKGSLQRQLGKEEISLD